VRIGGFTIGFPADATTAVKLRAAVMAMQRRGMRPMIELSFGSGTRGA
jgi:hypothetical protein